MTPQKEREAPWQPRDPRTQSPNCSNRDVSAQPNPQHGSLAELRTPFSLTLTGTSLCSTVTAAPRPGDEDAAAAEEERLRHAVLQLQDDFSNLSARLDKAVLGMQEDAKRIVEQFQRVEARSASCLEDSASRVADLEQQVDATSEEQVSMVSRLDMLEQVLEDVRALSKSKSELLEKSLNSEIDARAELEKCLTKELREQAAAELEQYRADLMNEMRERMDGQKVLRDESQFQQQSLTRLSTRLDELTMELRTEMPLLRQKQTSQKAEMDQLADLQTFCQQRVEGLEKGLAEEASARLVSEKALSEGLAEKLASDLARIRAEAAHEMRERVDGQKVLRDEVQKHQQSHTRLTTRVEELTMELREELPRLSQELGTLKADIEAMTDVQSSHASRMLTVEREIAEETTARRKSEKALGEELRKENSAETSRLTAQLTKLRDEMRTGSENLAANVGSLTERLDRDSSYFDETFRRLGGKVAATQDDCVNRTGDLQVELLRKIAGSEAEVRNHLDGKLLESEGELRKWVEASVLQRVNALENVVRPPPTERMQVPVAPAPYPGQQQMQMNMAGPHRTMTMRR